MQTNKNKAVTTICDSLILFIISAYFEQNSNKKPSAGDGLP